MSTNRIPTRLANPWLPMIAMLVTARFLPRYFANGITAPAQGEGSTSS